jgi:hypothetical protein
MQALLTFPKGGNFVKSIDEILEQWAQAFPAVFPRTAVTRLTEGIFNSRTLANHDSKGCGPKDAFMMNGKLCYRRENFLEYAKAHSGKPATTDGSMERARRARRREK